MKKIFISPSVLSSNFLNLRSEIEMLNKSEADFIHLDVMDGVFVPNISFGFPIIKQIKKISKKPLDVHIMITEPDRYIEEFANSGAKILTLHYEASLHLHRSVQKIKQNRMQAGVSINPHTPVFMLEDIIKEVDLVLIMSVNPGYGGQKFIENTYKKVKQLKEMIEKNSSKALIEVDGGVNEKNSKKLFNAGADILVAGSSIFKSKNPEKTIIELKKI